MQTFESCFVFVFEIIEHTVIFHRYYFVFSVLYFAMHIAKYNQGRLEYITFLLFLNIELKWKTKID